MSLSPVSLVVLSLLTLAGCDVTEPIPLFDTGSPAELVEAESRALAHLAAPVSPATMKQVGGVRVIGAEVDALRMAHVKVQQDLDGVPVFGGQAIVHLDRFGTVTDTTDSLIPDVKVNTQPAFGEDDAVERAVGARGGWADQSDEPKADLWVLRHAEVDHLVWRVQLREIWGDARDALPVVFVDAHTGETVWEYNNLQTASGSTNYYGTVSITTSTPGDGYYYLENTADGLGTYSWGNTTSSLYYLTDTDDVWTDASGVEGHFLLQASYDYYLGTFGRVGIDGAGGPAAISSHGYGFITATVNYSSNYANAYWDPTYQWLVFGDGDGYNLGPTTVLDVGGHEYTHGVTEYEADLTYSGESGGLNESMSDVFGAMVEASVLGESADTWWIGEDTWTPTIAGDALRYMNAPADDGYAYDYYFSSIGSADVHDSSGVGNLAFYLLANGGAHPTRGGTAVTGIGSGDAADIWYLALGSYMTSSTNYSGARTATLSAAGALFGTSSTQYASVGAAWSAVGVAGAASCTTSSYSGSISRSGRWSYQPGSSGTSSTAPTHSVSLTGPSSADFDLYLQKKSGRSWSTVASSTGAGSAHSVSYSGSSGTYRVAVYSTSGSGSYSVSWCK